MFHKLSNRLPVELAQLRDDVILDFRGDTEYARPQCKPVGARAIDEPIIKPGGKKVLDLRDVSVDDGTSSRVERFEAALLR